MYGNGTPYTSKTAYSRGTPINIRTPYNNERYQSPAYYTPGESFSPPRRTHSPVSYSTNQPQQQSQQYHTYQSPYHHQRDQGQQQQGQPDEQQFVPSILADALLAAKKQPGRSSPKSGSAWSSSPGSPSAVPRRRSLSRTPPSSPRHHWSGDELGSPGKSPKHSGPLPPTTSLFMDSPFDAGFGTSYSPDAYGRSPADEHRSASPKSRHSPMMVDGAEQALTPASSGSGSSGALETPTPIASGTVVTVSGTPEVDLLFEEIKQHGRIDAFKKGKNWIAIRYIEHTAARRAIGLDGTVWNDYVLTVRPGDTLNVLGGASRPSPRRTSQPQITQNIIPSKPVEIPGSFERNISPTETSRAAPWAVESRDYPEPSATFGGWERTKQPSRSNETMENGRLNNHETEVKSPKRPRPEDADADGQPPARRSPAVQPTGYIVYDDDDEDVVIRPAGWLSRLSDWIFGW